MSFQRTPPSPQKGSPSPINSGIQSPSRYGNLPSGQSGQPSGAASPEFQFTQIPRNDDSFPSCSQNSSQCGFWVNTHSSLPLYPGSQDSDFRYSQSQRIQMVSRGSCFSPVFPKSEFRQNGELSFCSQIHPPTFSWARYPPDSLECAPHYSASFIKSIVENDKELSPREDLFAKQTELKESDRIEIIQLFISKSDIFEVSSKSLFLAVRLFDRLLLTCDIKKEKLLLYGISCFSIAAKFNNSFYPQHSSYVSEMDFKFTPDDISATELIIVNQLKFKINCTTLPMFLNYWINQMEEGSLSLLRIAIFIGLCSLFSHQMSITDTKTVAVAVLLMAMSTCEISYKGTLLADVIKEMDHDKIMYCQKTILGIVEETTKDKHSPLCQLFTDIEGDCIYTDMNYSIQSLE